MWSSAGTGRWSRDEGYLIADGDLMLELHGDTVHVYRRDPAADPKVATGSPLDGYVWHSTEPVRKANPTAPLVDAPTAWRLLGDRAALDAARYRGSDPKTPRIPKPT